MPDPAPKSTGRLAVYCRGLVKDFGTGELRTRVLRGVDFEAEAGKTTFLVGPSGCGKTTLISVLAGLLSSDEGEVEVLGANLRKLRGGRLVDFRGTNIGFVFQQFNLLPSLTAAENAAVPLMAQGVSRIKAVRAAEEMLNRLGLDTQRNKYPNQLSGGQQQRVAIARALVHRPKLLISDEPTAALDAATGHTVMELLCEQANDGECAILVVTHDNRIYSFADRIAYMADGKILRTSEGKVDSEEGMKDEG